jgi:hypothetical protein
VKGPNGRAPGAPTPPTGGVNPERARTNSTPRQPPTSPPVTTARPAPTRRRAGPRDSAGHEASPHHRASHPSDPAATPHHDRLLKHALTGSTAGPRRDPSKLITSLTPHGSLGTAYGAGSLPAVLGEELEGMFPDGLELGQEPGPGGPSRARWSIDRVSRIRRRTATAPAAVATGSATTAPTARTAASGGLITTVHWSMPNQRPAVGRGRGLGGWGDGRASYRRPARARRAGAVWTGRPRATMAASMVLSPRSGGRGWCRRCRPGWPPGAWPVRPGGSGRWRRDR